MNSSVEGVFERIKAVEARGRIIPFDGNLDDRGISGDRFDFRTGRVEPLGRWWELIGSDGIARWQFRTRRDARAALVLWQELDQHLEAAVQVASQGKR